jgi:hypothetical protein
LNNELIQQIESYLKQNHFIKRDHELSTLWLGKSKKYYGMLKCSGRNCSAESAIYFSHKLMERGKLASRNQPAVGKQLIDFSNQVLSEVIPFEIRL